VYSVYYDNPSAGPANYVGFDGKPYYVFGDNFERTELGDDWEIIQELGVIEIKDGYLRLYTSSSGEDWSHNILRTTKGDFSKSSVNYKFAIGYQDRTDNYFLAQVFSPGANWLYDGNSLYEDEGHCGAVYPFSIVKWVEGTEIKMLDTGIMCNSLDEWHNIERTMVDDTHVNFKVDSTNYGDFEIPNEGNWVGDSYFLMQHGACILAQASSEVRYDNICIVNENHKCTKPDVGLKVSVWSETGESRTWVGVPDFAYANQEYDVRYTCWHGAMCRLVGPNLDFEYFGGQLYTFPDSQNLPGVYEYKALQKYQYYSSDCGCWVWYWMEKWSDTIEILPVDNDGDGVYDHEDLCPGTTLPENLMRNLLPSHYSDVDGDHVFELGSNKGVSDSEYSLTDTYGCSCQQILDKKPGKNLGEKFFGCTKHTINIWIEQRD